MKHLFLLALLLPLAVGAQVRKCQIDGKMIYSDTQCGQQGATVNTTANSVDSSGLRQQAQRDREEAKRQQETMEIDSQRAALAVNVPQECRFKYYTYGDAKGKVLSQNAKTECIQNFIDAKAGKPASREAYGMWKDHHDRMSEDRNAAVARASAAAAANAASGRVMTCTGNRGLAIPSMTCR